jgi:hypothetical protein
VTCASILPATLHPIVFGDLSNGLVRREQSGQK